MIKIVLPDQSVKEFDHNPSALEVAASIGSRLAQDTLGVRRNGNQEILDLRQKLNDGDKIELITTKSPDADEVIRHSTAHVLAQAVQSIWPEVKVTIGPVIDNGFYYDFDSPFTFTEEHFAQIEKKMSEIIHKDLPIRKEDWKKSEAISKFKAMGERFKVELIENLKDDTVGIYHNGDEWFDLCKGPHIQRTGQIKAFKLLSVAGAYWRGDEKNPMLQRVYATAFSSKAALEEHLKNLEEAQKRDHRKLGKELGLFVFNELSPGAPFFTGKGSVIYNQLQNFMRELYMEYDYQEVITPQIFDTELFVTSGHIANYKENMYFSEIDKREFATKPMNCPSHCLIYNSDHHSYRDLPIRMADFGRLHRYEKSGAMHGLTRVRTFCQDDGHIFCTVDQLQKEIESFMSLLTRVYKTLGMDEYIIYISTRPEKRMGSDETWDKSEAALFEGLKKMNLPYKINPGDGAFYGPKADIMFVDALKRPWQLGTLQVDYIQPDNFALKYVGEDNKEHRPVMLHRAILGSIERFIGVYLEHTAGHLPLWLSPVQVRILNITDRVNAACESLQADLKKAGIRTEFDARSEKLGAKIRTAQLAKIPLMVVMGDQEAEKGTVTVRLQDGSQKNFTNGEEFKHWILNEVRLKNLKIPKEVSH